MFSTDPCVSDAAERKMHHHNHGCALGPDILTVPEVRNGNHIVSESLAEMERKRKAQEDTGFPLNKKYGCPIPKHNIN